MSERPGPQQSNALAPLAQRNAELEAEVAHLRAEIAAARAGEESLLSSLNLIQRRLSFKVLSALWRAEVRLLPLQSRRRRIWLSVTRALRRSIRQPLLQTHVADSNRDWKSQYPVWVEQSDAVRFNRDAALVEIRSFSKTPMISIVMPVYNPEIQYLRAAIESVRRQYYARWELCICDDGSSDAQSRAVLEEYAAVEQRIKIAFLEANQGIAAASNEAVSVCSGEYVALLDQDDELTPDALYEVASAVQLEEADLIYSDEDKLDFEGRRCDPFLKPAWSPDLLLSTMYVGHLAVYRKNLMDSVGGFRDGFEGSQDHDLALRCTERAERIIHIPKILYHWRKSAGSAAAEPGAKPGAQNAGKKAVAEALRRRSIDGDVRDVNGPGYYHVVRKIPVAEKVSIVIPTRDGVSRLRRCVDSIEAVTNYVGSYEILIVDNDSRDQPTLDYLSTTRHRVIRDPGPFNFSRANNKAAKEATGHYLLLLNDDTEITSPHWLSALVEHGERPEVGAVGAKLLYPDGSIQHVGVILGLGGVGDHAQKGMDGGGSGYYNFPNIIRNYSAVTGACLFIRRQLYLELGGLDEANLPVGFNDVDLCLRLRRNGYLIVFTPGAVLFHHESASRARLVARREEQYMTRTWGADIASDPYYNPNLTLEDLNFGIDFSRPESTVTVVRQDACDEVGPILDSYTSLGQGFSSPGDGLCSIAIKFATYRRRVEGILRFHIRSSPFGPDIRSMQTDAATIRDNSLFVFAFEPIRHSAGRTFYFFVELENGKKAAALSIWKTASTRSDLGPHHVNHIPFPGTLAFRAHCHERLARAWSRTDSPVRMNGDGHSVVNDTASRVDGATRYGEVPECPPNA